MFYPKIFISSLAVIVFVHLSIFLFVTPTIEKPTKLSDSSTVVKIALKKVYVKQEKKEISKEVQKEVEKKPEPKPEPKKKKEVKKKKKKIYKKKKRVVKKRIKKQRVQQRRIEQAVVERPRIIRREEPVVTDSDLVTYRYLRRLKRAMERNKIYPSKAKSLGQEGVVVVSFVIQGNGRLTNTRITMECLYGRLNKAAYKIPIRIGTFEPIPRILNKKQWAIEVPITYEIEDD